MPVEQVKAVLFGGRGMLLKRDNYSHEYPFCWPELIQEGVVRELISKINGMRGEMGLKYDDKISFSIQ